MRCPKFGPTKASGVGERCAQEQVFSGENRLKPKWKVLG